MPCLESATRAEVLPTVDLPIRSSWIRLLGWLVAATCLFAVADTVADPDLWGHLRFGLDLLESGQVVQRDRYSYLSDRPWINHEWLAEAIFAGVYRVGGPSGLVVLKVVFGGLILGSGFFALEREGHPVAGSLLMLAVTLGLRPGLGSLRPQVFTYLLFLALLVVLRRSSRGRPGLLWLVPPILAVWVNCHGGVLAGLAVIIIWGCVTAWEILRERAAPMPLRLVRLLKVAMPLTLCLPALVLNPYGAELIRFLLKTGTVPRPEISEWAPVYLSAVPGLSYAALLLIAGCAWAVSRRPRSLPLAAVHLATALAPLLAVRHLPLFAVATLILAAEHVTDIGNRWLPPKLRSETPGAWVGPALTVAIAIMAILGVRGLRGIRLDPGSFDYPVRAVDWIQESDAVGNLVVDFDWGEYVLWRLGSRLKVSIDGRRETVYSAEALERDARFREGRPGWDALLRCGNPPMALLRRDSRAEHLMRRQTGWTAAYEDRLCTLFLRDDAASRCRLSNSLTPEALGGPDGTWFPAAAPR